MGVWWLVLLGGIHGRRRRVIGSCCSSNILKTFSGALVACYHEILSIILPNAVSILSYATPRNITS